MRKAAFVAAVAGSVVVADQLSKWYIRHTIPLFDAIPIIEPVVTITHLRNPGGAFSLFAGASDAVRVPFFLAAATLAIGALVYFLVQIPASQRWLLFAVAGVLGGALGNLIDRIWFGQVTDFILVHWRAYAWPAFNVADSFISIGIAVLVAHSLFARDAPGAAASAEKRP